MGRESRPSRLSQRGGEEVSKLPAVIWALGFSCWQDVADYLDFLAHKTVVHDDTYRVICLTIWAGGIVLFWPRKAHP